ncbi:hypothetical protein AUM89_04895, partial [Cronobacter sakazakii]|nr:hypothetical protein [Cronobacter sakazakii]EGT4325046.1 hypothetical protein [Cronobacter sakazakii]EGT4362707.1 hypothetical protein [Cronobacter sakazakii]
DHRLEAELARKITINAPRVINENNLTVIAILFIFTFILNDISPSRDINGSWRLSAAEDRLLDRVKVNKRKEMQMDV